MAVFTASLTAATITAAGGDSDIFDITPNSLTRIRILEVELNQYSDFGDAQAEILGITFIRGHTTVSNGSSITPIAVENYGPPSVTTVVGNGTTIASGGTAITMLATSWNLQAGFIWRPPEALERSPHRRQFIIKPSERLVIRNVSTLTDDITANCTVTFEEIGLGQYPVG